MIQATDARAPRERRRAALFAALFVAASAILAGGIVAASLRLERAGSEERLVRLASILHGLERRLEVMVDRVGASGDRLGSLRRECEGIASRLEALHSLLPGLAARGEMDAAPQGSGIDGTEESQGGDPDRGASEHASREAAELPELPEGLGAQRAVREGDLAALLGDERLNPRGVELPREERERLAAELLRARGRVEQLEGEIQLALSGAARTLEAEGRFVDYARGEAYAAEEGVLTLARALPGGGTRMFYLYPEEHPEVYEKRAEKRQVAELFLRRLLREIQTQETEE